MASAVNINDLTLGPKEATQVDMAVFEKAYNRPELKDAHDVRTGVQMKTQIPIFGQMGDVGKVSSGCTPNAGGTITTTQKYADPALVDFRVEHCEGDVDQLFKLWKRDPIALQTWENIDDEMMGFIGGRTLEALYSAILRISSFGDKTAKLVANGGVITAGQDIGLLTMIDGIWKQIFAAVTAGTITNHYTITENALSTKTAQLALASDTAVTALRSLYNNADPRMFSFPNVKYQITRSLLGNMYDYLEDKALGFTLDNVVNGIPQFKYRGIPIIVRDDWSNNIIKFEDNGTTFNKPHRAILAPISNIPIITSDNESLSNFASFYDKVSRKHYIDVAFYIDAKVIEEYAIGAAY